MGLGVASAVAAALGLEPPGLLLGHVELAVPVGELPAADAQLEPIGHVGSSAGWRASGDTSTGKPYTNTGSRVPASKILS